MEMLKIPQDKETKDQVALIMGLFGTPSQQEETREYFKMEYCLVYNEEKGYLEYYSEVKKKESNMPISTFELRPRVDLYGIAKGHWLDRRVMEVLTSSWALTEDDLIRLKDDITDYLQELNHRKVAQLKEYTNAKIK